MAVQFAQFDMAHGMRAVGGIVLVAILVVTALSVLFLRSSVAPDGGAPSIDPPDEPPLTAPPPPPGRSGNGGGTGFGRGGPPKPRPGGSDVPNPEPITDRFDEIDAALGELVSGNVVFNTPERMRFGEARTVALIASPTLDAATLSSQIRSRIGGADPIEIETVEIAPIMEAHLEGEPAFAVAPLTPARQPMSRAAPTEWRWSVRANQPGTHALHLTVNAIITVAGDRYPRSVDVFDRTIVVDIAASQRIGMFVENNWQWLLGTILIPLAVWRWSVRGKKSRRRRS